MVEEKYQWGVYREPDAGPGKLGDSYGDSGSRSSQGDGTVDCQWALISWWVCRVVGSLAIGLEKEYCIVVVGGSPSDESVDSSRRGGIRQRNVDLIIRHDEDGRDS